MVTIPFGKDIQVMKTKVLVIDDYIPAAEMLSLVMEMQGYDVMQAYKASSAFEITKTFVPDVILCDINMPDMQGNEVCRRMRQDERLKGSLFIAQTAVSHLLGGDLIREAGFDYHLVKPLDIGVLGSIIKKHFGDVSKKASAA